MNNTPVDTIVLGGIDSFLPTRNADKQFLVAVNDKVREAISNQDVREIENIGKSILGISQVTGIAFSEFIYTVEACWNDLKQRDSFFDWAEDKFGKNKVTLERHQRIWDMFISGDIPKEYVDKFKTMPIRVLIPIANLWHQGYEVTDLQWKKLSNCPDPTSVNKEIRAIKGKEEKAGTLKMEWSKDQKAITGWENGKPYTIHLSYQPSPTIDKMLARLFGDGRVMEK